jgi:hypothetical protein
MTLLLLLLVIVLVLSVLHMNYIRQPPWCAPAEGLIHTLLLLLLLCINHIHTPP